MLYDDDVWDYMIDPDHPDRQAAQNPALEDDLESIIDERTNGATQHQKQVIEHTLGNMIVFATAGSGKTRSITNMVALRIQSGLISPHRVAMITFTRKAANVMQERLQDILGNVSHQIKINTFHGLCRSLLKEMPEGYFEWWTEDEKQMKVIDENQSIDILEGIREGCGKLNNKIQQYKLRLIDDLDAGEDQIYQKYNEKLRELHYLDYSDLLKNVVDLANNDDIRKFLQSQFDLVVVDEYQDTNALQDRIVEIFSESADIIVVGDDDQSIFAFQGARVDNILEFKEKYQNVKEVYLPDNFRCSPAIFKAAKNLISHNKRRAEKGMRTFDRPCNPVYLGDYYSHSDALEQMQGIIEQWLESGSKYSEIAVLGRTNGILGDFYKDLSKIIPCDYGNMSFVKRAEIRDLQAYLQYLLNGDDLAFSRIAKKLTGVGASTIQKILGEKNKGCLSPVNRHDFPLQRPDVLNLALVNLPSISKRARASLELFESQLRSIDTSMPAQKIVHALLTASPMCDGMEEERVKRIEKLLMQMDPEQELLDFLLNFEEIEVVDNCVQFSTIHKAKGREWNNVILLGLNEGILPHSREDDIEIERRLAFVGMTRAKDNLVLMHDSQREISRFIAESALGSALVNDDYADAAHTNANDEEEASALAWLSRQQDMEMSLMSGQGPMVDVPANGADVLEVQEEVYEPHLGG